MAWRLANSKQPFLYVIRSGSICGSDWIDLLPQGFAEAIGERGVRLNMFMVNGLCTESVRRGWVRDEWQGLGFQFSPLIQKNLQGGEREGLE
ncbi:hypothetical protein ACFX14_014562 [Malus domestica]